MKKDSLIFVLHAHLPYVKEPDIPFSIEETWLYEILTESYIPLYLIFEELKKRGLNFRIVMSLSPTIIEMLKDKYFIKNYERYLEMVINILEREMIKRRNTPFEGVVRFYNERLRSIRKTFYRLKKDILKGFIELRDNIRFITTSATHALLPLLEPYRYGIHAQVKIGIDTFKSFTGLIPQGFWLPECGYSEIAGESLTGNGIKWSFVEGHGLLFGEPLPSTRIFRPVVEPSGLLLFPRDSETCRLIWCSRTGYPGNAYYREFYRDISSELSKKEWMEISDGLIFSTGLKFYRITGNERKMPYIRDIAMEQVKKDARDFYGRLKKRFLEARRFTDIPVITVAFDAELFGHWWFEGPEWLMEFLKIVSSDRDIETSDPHRFMEQKGDMLFVKPVESTWGGRGFNDTWVSPENSHLIKEIHKGIVMVRRLLEENVSDEQRRERNTLQLYLKQAVRECLLMQASDLLFMIKGGEFREYAQRRFQGYVTNLNDIYSILNKKERLLLKKIKEMEKRAGIFRDIDPYVFLEVS